VADYRGLTNAELVELRAKLRASGARLKVVKNTLTRRAAEEVGNESLLVLLEGPTAIAFVEAEGDPVAVAKALADTARDTKVLELRGGLLSGRSITGADVEELAKLPAPEVVKSQLVGVIVAPLTQLAALVAAPLRDLAGLIDARIAQLEEGGDTSASASTAVDDAPVEDAKAADAPDTPEPAAEVVAEQPEDTNEASEPAEEPAEAENADTGNEEE
jgi:large subunit ribosomal protein L10